jgi:hypothetical protein
MESNTLKHECSKHRNYPVPEHCPICEAVAALPPKRPIKKSDWALCFARFAYSSVAIAGLFVGGFDKDLALTLIVPAFIVGAIVESIEP